MGRLNVLVILTTMTVCILTIASVSVFAAPVNIPPTTVDPIIDGSMNSFPGEYTLAKKFSGDGGTIYRQYKINWRARSVQTGRETVYPNAAYFDLNDLWNATTIELSDYNVFSQDYNEVNITVWIFAGENEPDDSDWIGNSGLGLVDIDDRGFLARKNGDPASDRHWLPGDPEPGDAGWNWDAYYGVFARAYDPAQWEGNEVYEVVYFNTGNEEGRPPLKKCKNIQKEAIRDPVCGQARFKLKTIWVGGPIHIGLPGDFGGIVILINKFDLMAPYIGLASTVAIATVATVVYFKRVKRRKEKQ